jgi:hypothetical protein
MSTFSTSSSIASLDPARVQRAIQWGHQRLKPFRDVRTYVMREYAGAWYGQMPDLVARSDGDKRPINLIHESVQAWLSAIVGEELRFQVKPRRSQLRAEGKVREMMLNHRATEIGLLHTHRLAVLDALLGGLGIYKVGVGESGDSVRFKGTAYDPGKFYCGRVDLDDYACDPYSRDPREDCWRADRFRISKQALIESGKFDPDVVANLPSLRSGSPEDQGHTHEISGPSETGDEQIYDEVELWDVTITHGKKVLRGILPGLHGNAQWLIEPEEYLGYEGGPYVRLSFEDVPSNTMGLAPAASLLDLHIALARMGVKAVRQALRSGRAIFYHPTEEDLVARLNEVPDDEFYKTTQPDKVNAVEVGGLAKNTTDAIQWLRQQANIASAGVDQSRGVSAGNAKTATEVGTLQANMNRILSGMRARARDALSTIAMHMAKDQDTDVFAQRIFSERIGGVGEVELMYDGSQLEGDMTEFSWDVIPYDEPRGDRNLELARFVQMLQVIPSAVQTVATLGGDVQALMRITAEKMNVPELDEIFPSQDTMAAEQTVMAQAEPPQPTGIKQGNPRPETQGGVMDQTRSDMAPSVPGGIA